MLSTLSAKAMVQPKPVFLSAPAFALVKPGLQVALQPIVNASTGEIFGYEALMRGHDVSGFESPLQLLDTMHRAGALDEVEGHMQNLAFRLFCGAPDPHHKTLFLNIDGRLLSDPNAIVSKLDDLMHSWALPPTALCLELSEQFDNFRSPKFPQFVQALKDRGWRLAIDDFGTGYAEMNIISDFVVDFIKIDRHFVHDIDKSRKKRLMVGAMASLGRSLGFHVVAEGIETEAEYRICHEIGCDLAQGYFIARPSTDLTAFPVQFPRPEAAATQHRRFENSDDILVRRSIEATPALPVDSDMQTVLDAFRTNTSRTFFPIIGHDNCPLGMVNEQDIKAFTYSPYGHSLLKNKASQQILGGFLRKAPVADINTSIDALVSLMSDNDGSDMVIVTEEMKYVGTISSSALIGLVNARNLGMARDLNPLSSLPGNNAIRRYIEDSCASPRCDRNLIYFDFDHFKAYNDVYGFQAGDQAIILFSDILRTTFNSYDYFIGHIGGDDFFVGSRDLSPDQVADTAGQAVADFKRRVQQLYSESDRARGYIEAQDRAGNDQQFPLMSCSVGQVEISPDWASSNTSLVTALLAKTKKSAKTLSERYARVQLTNPRD